MPLIIFMIVPEPFMSPCFAHRAKIRTVLESKSKHSQSIEINMKSIDIIHTNRLLSAINQTQNKLLLIVINTQKLTTINIDN